MSYPQTCLLSIPTVSAGGQVQFILHQAPFNGSRLLGFFNLITSGVFKKKIIDFREGGREKERSVNLLFHLSMHSLVDSCMCHDRGIKHAATLVSQGDALTNLATQPGLAPDFSLQLHFHISWQSDGTLQDFNTKDKFCFLMAWHSGPPCVCALPTSWPHALCPIECGSHSCWSLSISWEILIR